MELNEFVKKGHELYLRHISIDCVIVGFHDEQLKVLLLKWKENGQWCLPGGFVRKDDSLDVAATRILRERTGLQDLYLQQFHTFGDPARERNKEQFLWPRTMPPGSWMHDRFISVGYYALVEFSQVTPQPDLLTDECHWCDIHDVPDLIYDHNAILDKALETLRMRLNDYPVGLNLLPARFTMPELQRLYETILDTPLDRRNFQKKMLAFGILERLTERKTGGAHKAPYLYRFDRKKYEKALKQGLKFGF
ncbi:NUDIX hydrolase [Dawidia soli]|uniref:NUDIX domain-containing protein n=1 Tax=Dawidia soli TaxID=2782352 RepID=A0AAP2GJR4_9BACT|nr:NUDIX domain-containing protein [Dawidia soli]MBT1688253.1 NUDIX domain-containing protein [Dawidia soli]